MRPSPVAIALACALLAPAPRPVAADPGTRCLAAAARQLRACLRRVHAASRTCFLGGTGPCEVGEAISTRELDTLVSRIRGRCGKPGAVAAAGHAVVSGSASASARA